jgi:hypothetical protein
MARRDVRAGSLPLAAASAVGDVDIVFRLSLVAAIAAVAAEVVEGNDDDDEEEAPAPPLTLCISARSSTECDLPRAKAAAVRLGIFFWVERRF